MGVFLGYVLLGLSLAAPIGPINAAQLEKGIRSGFFHSWLVGLGAMTADAIYMLLVYIGVVRFLEIPIIQTFLWLFGFFVLVYTGVESILNAGKLVSESRLKSDSLKKSFFYGFIMSITNPLSILFWLGIYGSILAKTIAQYDHLYVIIYSLAIFLGLLIWDVTMASVASTFRRLLSVKILAGISIASGLSLIGFGLYFGMQAVKLLLNT